MYKTLFLILAFIFLIHNIEECKGFEALSKTFHNKLNIKLKDRVVFGLAQFFLSTIVFLLAILGLTQNCLLIIIFSKIIIFGLFFNALWHCSISMYKKKLIPGTISALFLIIPITCMLIYTMHNDFGDDMAILLRYSLFSLVLLPIVIYISLWMGYGVKQLIIKLSTLVNLIEN